MRKLLRNFTGCGLFVLLSVLLWQVAGPVQAADLNWAEWKGPNRNGVSDEKDWNPEFLKAPLVTNWQVNVGKGYSNVAIHGDFLYTMGFRGEKNFLLCLDAKTGKKIWEYGYSATPGKYIGPKSSPVIEDDRVYSTSQDGDMLCNNAKTGKLLWRKNVVTDFGAKMPMWSFSSSVCIEGNLLLMNACNSGIALDKITGNTIWKSEPGEGNYTTPVSFHFGGKLYSAIFGREHLFVVDVKTGKVLWSYPWKTKHQIVAADPVIIGNQMYISSGYENGGALLDFSSGKPVTLWRNQTLANHFTTSIIFDGYLYGVDGNAGNTGFLKCLDLNDGAEKWSKELGFGQLIAANGYLIVLNEKGSLHVVKVDPTKYQGISRKENILGKLCWTAPVLCRSTLYLRNDKGDLISISAK